MGINYYLRPNGFNDLDSINYRLKDRLDLMRDEYVEYINTNLKDINQELKDIADYIDPDSITLKIQWEFEAPEIHICKLSRGWIPSFESSTYYKSFDELKSFIQKHSNDLIIVDEYNNKYTLEQFEKEIEDHFNDNVNNRHHVEDWYGIRRWTDNREYDWTDNSFS